MARFRLKEKHYINIEGGEWEQKEEVQGPIKGRFKQVRKSYPVPTYFDPEDPSDHNYPGEIIITTVEDRRYPHDFLCREGFQPTFDMEPLDDEAEAMLEVYRKAHPGQHAIESLPGQMGEDILNKFLAQITALGGREAHVSPAVSVAEFEAMKAQNATLSAKLDEVLAKLASTAQPASVLRRT